MKTIQIFELGLGKITVIPFKDLIPPDLADQLERYGSTIGVGLEITTVTDATKFVEHYFREQGYQVLDLSNQKGASCDKIQDLEGNGKLPAGVAAAARERGVPDYFCYKGDDDWFFTEAKNEKDGLRLTQLNWFYKHKYRTKVLYLAEGMNESL